MAWYWWVAAGIALAVVEIATVDLIFIMLAAGAAAGAVASALGAPLVAQVLVAGAVAVLMLVAVRPVALRHLRQPVDARTGVAALPGQPAVVVEKVDGYDGRVRVHGEVWSARSLDPKRTYEPGTTVDIVRIDGATAVVLAPER